MSKAFILEEICRTAGENGGVPLGIKRFQQETGIRQSDWWKFWPRWSEALREAGFKPNELTGAYAKDDLLRKYADLAKELGKIPSSADLRFRSRKEPGFPNQRTFETRLGAMRKLVEQVECFCREEDGYKAVIPLCEEYASRHSMAQEEAATRTTPIGFVYLIKSARFYKIGKTNAAGRREREIALQLPEKATTVHVIRTDDPSGIEDYWHKRFESNRRNGEWFELSAGDVAAFKRRKFM